MTCWPGRAAAWPPSELRKSPRTPIVGCDTCSFSSKGVLPGAELLHFNALSRRCLSHEHQYPLSFAPCEHARRQFSNMSMQFY